MITKTLHRIERIHQLVKMEATGSPKELACKLEISESHLYNILSLMRQYDAPVYFNRSKNSYCYKKEVRLQLLKFSCY